MKRIVVLLVIVGCGGASVSPDGGTDGAATADSRVDVPDAFTDAVDVPDAFVDTVDVPDAFVDTVDVPDAFVDTGVDAGPACPLGAICDNPDLNYAFITSTARAMGDIGGLAGADTICNDAATAAGLPGTYVAWLSSSTENAVDRIGTASGWLRVDHRPFAQSVADLLSGDLRYPLNVDENGERAMDAVIVPTATGVDGTRSGTETCADWTDSSPTRRPLGGATEAGSRRWTSGFLMNCNTVVQLYCLGVDSDQAYTLPVVEGRRAWVSEGTLTGDAGLAAGDALCVAEGVGLTGTPRALMATTSASAISRFDVSGLPWIRPDGIPLWADPADRRPLAPLVQQFDGTVVEHRVWTGALGMQDLATDNCNDWTSTDGAVQSSSGTSDYSGTSWFGGTASCDRADHVYCLED